MTAWAEAVIYSSPIHLPSSLNSPNITATIGEPRTFGVDVTKKF